MVGDLKQIVIKPRVLDKDGFMAKEECAVVTCVVPIDKKENIDEITHLMSIMDGKEVFIDIKERQLQLPIDKDEDENANEPGRMTKEPGLVTHVDAEEVEEQRQRLLGTAS